MNIINSKMKKITKYLETTKSIILDLEDESINKFYEYIISNKENDNMGARAIIVMLENTLIDAISSEIFKKQKYINNYLLQNPGKFITIKIRYEENERNQHIIKSEIV